MADDPTVEAERITLGAMMLDPAAIEVVAARLRSTDYADPRHGAIHAAITAAWAGDSETGPVGIALGLNAVGELQRVGGTTYLHTLVASVPTTASVAWYADRVAEASAVRSAAVDVARLSHVVAGGDLGQIEAERVRLVEAWSRRSRQAAADSAAELDDFLDQEDAPYDWIAAGLIERGDRLVVTGPEGGGKSTLLRQIGVQLASGIHPFGGANAEPLCVLVVDLENSAAQSRRALRSLRLAAGDRYQSKPGLHMRVRPEGIDLLSASDGRWLLDLCGSVRPDVLITGPIYKLAGGDPTSEEVARSVTTWLDRIRVETGTALIIEAHTPHGANGGKRPIRPYGASLWLRWPEFGIHLSPDGQVQHWRGPRDERTWPAALQRGGEWPWTPVTNPTAIRWAKIVDLCTEAGAQLSERDLAQLLGCSQPTIHRDIANHPNEWARLASPQVGG